jgi:hypothetical protein
MIEPGRQSLYLCAVDADNYGNVIIFVLPRKNPCTDVNLLAIIGITLVYFQSNSYKF